MLCFLFCVPSVPSLRVRVARSPRSWRAHAVWRSRAPGPNERRALSEGERVRRRAGTTANLDEWRSRQGEGSRFAPETGPDSVLLHALAENLFTLRTAIEAATAAGGGGRLPGAIRPPGLWLELLCIRLRTLLKKLSLPFYRVPVSTGASSAFFIYTYSICISRCVSQDPFSCALIKSFSREREFSGRASNTCSQWSSTHLSIIGAGLVSSRFLLY